MTEVTRWAEVDTGAIAHNTRLVKSVVGTETAVMAVVKANGYGHGAVPAAQAAIEGGATWLGVSSVQEGIELRKAGLTVPILNLGYTPPVALSAAVASKLSLTLYDVDSLARFKAAATEIGVHVKVNTGMNRLGAQPAEAIALASEVHRDGRLRLEGFWTHFSSADEDIEYTRSQLGRYLEARGQLQRAGVTGFLSHAANSAGLIRLPAARLDLVRAGLVIYGVSPVRDWNEGVRLRPALSWQTIVTHVQTVAPGEAVGYGRRFAPLTPARIATIAVGYADGLQRRLSLSGRALVRGHSVPIAGTISMDQAALDVSSLPVVRVGDVVTLIGRDGDATSSADDLAEAAGTISYEVLCAISSRVLRRYI